MKTAFRRLALAALFAAPILISGPALAQTPTPEGTVITNTATATWTDANGNAYTPVVASASVTVGFLPGADITAVQSSITPATPSVGLIANFTITNTGNGVDTLSISASIPAGLTVTGYLFNGLTLSLAQLNTTLATLGIPAGTTITIGVVYNVENGHGGSNLALSLTVTSLRNSSGAGTDTAVTTVSPPLAAAVAVTPDAGSIDRLPSNSTVYTETFTITNEGNKTDTFTLLALDASFLDVISVNGTAGSTGTITLDPGASSTFTITYLVANAAVAGTSQALTVTATSANSVTIQDTGTLTINVIRANLTMTKVAFRDDQVTAITSSMRVLPREYIQYQLTVTNTGAASATGVTIADPLPAQVTYVSASGGAGWTITEVNGTVTGVYGPALAPGASQVIWVRVQVK